jgi:succinate dehydrogenase/fumarate reductase-like Fe-S protein
MTAGRLHALLILSWAFLVMLAKKVFRFGPRGLRLFRANFEAEHLSNLDATERAEIASFSRCIACGRCDVGDGARKARSRGAYPGTMALMLASSRSMPDFGAAAEALRFISDDDLAEKEALCPTAVPMRKIAAFVRRHARPN